MNKDDVAESDLVRVVLGDAFLAIDAASAVGARLYAVLQSCGVVSSGILELLVDEAELARRREAWTPRERPTPLAGAAEKYARLVGSADRGAVTHSGALTWPAEPVGQ